ncbi:MAG: MCE family protein [Alcanivoracaceae bacterium]|nr:MCE family protein [Alcanivoracaceae bacterium]
MKRVYNNYFLVGVFTIIIGGVSILLLLNMSGKNKDAESYYSYFDNVTGLGYGNPVYYEGYRVGQVEDITPETINGKLLFKTKYTLIKGWKVPIDSITKIESSGLLSDMSLSIHAGVETEIFPVNSEIKGIKGDDIMATMSALAKDFSTLNEEKISPLFDLVYERTDSLTKSLETQIPEILTSIDVLVKDMNKLVVSADKLLTDNNIQGINHIIANVEDLSKQLSSLGSWVENSFDNVNKLIASGEQLVNNSDDKVGTLLDITIKMLDSFSVKAETIANEFESASMNINEATEIIRRNPSSLIFDDKSKVADEDL